MERERDKERKRARRGMQVFLDEVGRKGGKNGRRRNNLIRSKPNQIGRRPGKPRKGEGVDMKQMWRNSAPY